MVPETLTKYERRHMENIRRNGKMMASLKLRRIASDLSSSSVSQSMATTKKRPCPSPAPRSPVVLRCSLLTRCISPNRSPSLSSDPPSPPPNPAAAARKRIAPFPTADTLVGAPDRPIEPDRRDFGNFKGVGIGSCEGKGSGFDPRRSMALREETVRKVLRERILAVRFLPFGDNLLAGPMWSER
uniref:Uncharacterized protein n=1 Tax=Ananas comosus var. bracteatus TaxID=296719 RepID=A0A6V7NXN1_ANACO|nr:unnamed protein product [Ananas comosus var. bracteatus]